MIHYTPDQPHDPHPQEDGPDKHKGSGACPAWRHQALLRSCSPCLNQVHLQYMQYASIVRS